MPCFSAINNGKCDIPKCQYNHSTEVLRAEVKRRYELLTRSPYFSSNTAPNSYKPAQVTTPHKVSFNTPVISRNTNFNGQKLFNSINIPVSPLEENSMESDSNINFNSSLNLEN